MDRQPLTDRLGDRLLAEYGGAAAAYSLRALNGNGDSVVRVRRASDNDEKDFTASQVSSGEMVNWVTEGSATADGFVETWYDQSGNGNDASQATTTSQRKIVDGGTLLTEGGSPAILGNTYKMQLSSPVALSGEFSIISVYNAAPNQCLLGGSVNNPRIRIFNESVEFVNNTAGEINIGNTDNPPSLHTFDGSRIMAGFYRDGSDVVNVTIAGQTVADDSQTLSGTFSFSQLFARASNADPVDTKCQEIIIWPYDIRA